MSTQLILVCAVLLVLLFAWGFLSRNPSGSLSIVVARYREDILWMSRVKHDVQFFLYLKGPDLTDAEQATLPAKVEVIRLPNVGRCDHTFLHHIVSHFDSLTDVTVFVSGDGGDARKGPIIQHVITKAIATMDTILRGQHMHNVRDDLATFELKEWTSTSEVNQQGEGASSELLPAPIRPFHAWYDAQFPELQHTHIQVVCWTSSFAVHRRHIQQHPVERYQRILLQLQVHSKPEVGHYMERSWAALFWPYPLRCARH